jgi:hypothetical protein
MSLTDNGQRLAACTNVANCAKALTGETIEWYRGAGEYCPECGEVLSPRGLSRVKPASSEAAAAGVGALPPVDPNSAIAPEIDEPILGEPDKPHWIAPQRIPWMLAGVSIATGALMYGLRAANSSNMIAVCSTPSARQLAADLVRSYATHSGTPANRFVLTDGSSCDVRFSTAAETADAVIARDGIVAIVNPHNPISSLSQKQLRAIFGGSIRDWSQLGGPRAAIVPILPDASSDEANVIATSIFFGTVVDAGVRRGGSSADLTRVVTGVDRANRWAIGLVAFSQAVGAKVVPLVRLAPPSALSIASGRYPYWWTIAVESGSSRSTGLATGLVDYARSRDGATIVRKDGLAPPKAL